MVGFSGHGDVFMLCTAQCQVLLIMCGKRVRGVVGGRAAWGKEQGREDACSGHLDDTDNNMCACVVRASCGGASGPSSCLHSLINEGWGLEAGVEARVLNLGCSLCLGHACSLGERVGEAE